MTTEVINWFAAFQPDGTLPDECDESTGGSSDSTAEVSRPPIRGPWDFGLLCAVGSCVERAVSLVPEDDEGLPPLLIITGDEEDGGEDFLRLKLDGSHHFDVP